MEEFAKMSSCVSVWTYDKKNTSHQQSYFLMLGITKW